MPKRKHSERDGDRAAEARQKQQLYLIFDDWSGGYTIREVNLPSGPSHQTAVSGEVTEQRLPPPFFRLEATRGRPNLFAYAFGTSIIAAHPQDPLTLGSPEIAMPIFDVRKRSFTFGPPLGLPHRPIFLPVGDTSLFALHTDCLELLRSSPRRNVAGGEWSWHLLPEPPFLPMGVVSYAVHPDGPSILLSTESLYSGSKGGTFTFHTNKSVWTKHGEWMLPFAGRAHLDGDLGILVGLSRDPETLGHLCSCDKASLNTCNSNTDECPAPAWKLCPKKLFSGNPGERHVSATLVYLGSKSKFCLVECIFFEHVDRAHQVLKEGGKHGCYMYRLTKFSLSYDRKGDLQTKSRRVRYYKGSFPRENGSKGGTGESLPTTQSPPSLDG
ncbi:hypothetical protein C2845_PM01G48600 [Panicum miliaceum]|uniref:DUF1618 domain-containing protein n=1 Tax=Panicum miliaceum TaxID=4540 RepID=A0A3L6TFD6_PANMI|nr:hypothetical protein C2845_PM01G48600 [Panicum miliaceum]